jgi:hypothetical protein
MRDGRLRELDAFLNVSGAEADFFSNGASPLFLERAQDAAARRVGDGVEEAVEIGGGRSHKEKGSREQLVIL